MDRLNRAFELFPKTSVETVSRSLSFATLVAIGSMALPALRLYTIASRPEFDNLDISSIDTVLLMLKTFGADNLPLVIGVGVASLISQAISMRSRLNIRKLENSVLKEGLLNEGEIRQLTGTDRELDPSLSKTELFMHAVVGPTMTLAIPIFGVVYGFASVMHTRIRSNWEQRLLAAAYPDQTDVQG